MSRQGHQLGGFVGFLKGLKRLCERVNPQRVIVVWEGGGSPRRRAIYPEYKSGRRPQRLNRYYDDDIPDTYQNRNYQIKLTIDALKCIAVHQLYVDDCEADDVIGYMARYMFSKDKIIIVSSDKDLYQLIDQRVTQWSPGQKKFIRPDDVFNKFGVWPANICAVRCFVGDPSDCLEGVSGAGFKTMTKRFPSLAEQESVLIHDILEEAEDRKDLKIKLYKNIVSHRDIVKRNWKLMHLDVRNLSANQVKKIVDSVNNYIATKNKMDLMRLFVREGIQNFDIDSFFMTINSSIN